MRLLLNLIFIPIIFVMIGMSLFSETIVCVIAVTIIVKFIKKLRKENNYARN